MEPDNRVDFTGHSSGNDREAEFTGGLRAHGEMESVGLPVKKSSGGPASPEAAQPPGCSKNVGQKHALCTASFHLTAQTYIFFLFLFLNFLFIKDIHAYPSKFGKNRKV